MKHNPNWVMPPRPYAPQPGETLFHSHWEDANTDRSPPEEWKIPSNPNQNLAFGSNQLTLQHQPYPRLPAPPLLSNKYTRPLWWDRNPVNLDPGCWSSDLGVYDLRVSTFDYVFRNQPIHKQTTNFDLSDWKHPFRLGIWKIHTTEKFWKFSGRFEKYYQNFWEIILKYSKRISENF